MFGQLWIWWFSLKYQLLFSALKLIWQLKLTICLNVFVFIQIFFSIYSFHSILRSSYYMSMQRKWAHEYSSISSLSDDWIPATSSVSVFSHELSPVTWHISVHVILPLKQVQARVSHAPWQLHLISSMIAEGADVFVDGVGIHSLPFHCQPNISFFTSGMEMIGLWACLQDSVWTKALNKCCLKVFGIGGSLSPWASFFGETKPPSSWKWICAFSIAECHKSGQCCFCWTWEVWVLPKVWNP